MADEVTCEERQFKWEIKFHQYIIGLLLFVVGFMSGFIVSAERMRAQVITNTVKIDTIDQRLVDIDGKLDKLLQER